MIAVAQMLAKMSAREKAVFYCAACFIGLAALDRLLIGPVGSRLKLLDERIEAQTDLIKKNVRIVAEKDRVKAMAKEYSVYSHKAATHEEEVAYLLGEVEKLARKASLYIVDMKPLPMTEDANSRKYSVDLNCEGQLEQIISFMHETESTTRLLVVESFNFSPKSKDSSVAKCNMRISNIIFL